ncbi:hypothetical protein C8Q74DRAFT_1213469 [Fomes fomentarius]|nr:hypothetical protein C8Q74DRAFT_1213469 [Fomes fomentarius]
MPQPILSPVPRYPDIIIALDLMSTTPPRFHWFIFVPNDPATNAASANSSYAGTKLHAVTNGLQGDDRRWSYDRSPLSLATSPAVAAAAVISRLPANKGVDDLDALLKQIPMATPGVDRDREPAWTCRVWIREAVRRMHAHGYVVCEDVDALEEEMWTYGRRAAAMIEEDTFSVATLHTAVNARGPT